MSKIRKQLPGKLADLGRSAGPYVADRLLRGATTLAYGASQTPKKIRNIRQYASQRRGSYWD